MVNGGTTMYKQRVKLSRLRGSTYLAHKHASSLGSPRRLFVRKHLLTGTGSKYSIRDESKYGDGAGFWCAGCARARTFGSGWMCVDLDVCRLGISAGWVTTSLGKSVF